MLLWWCLERRGGRRRVLGVVGLIFVTIFWLHTTFNDNTTLTLDKRLQASLDVAKLRATAPTNMTELMAERARRVGQVCQKYNHTLLQRYEVWRTSPSSGGAMTRSLTNFFLLLARPRSIAWCQVPKVASTSLVFGLLRMLDIQTDEMKNPHAALRKVMFPMKYRDDLSGYTTFMIVRHPLQRILSAYRDKFLSEKYIGYYAARIIRKHRTQPVPSKYTNVPTFWEFVEDLRTTPVEEFNEHWLPYYILCTPCLHHYSFIIHMENLEQETNFLAEVTGIPELIPEHVHSTEIKKKELTGEKSLHAEKGDLSNQNNKLKTRDEANFEDNDYSNDKATTNDQESSNNSSSNISIENKEAFYYSQISMQQLLGLYEVYRIDMEMFGYDLSPYESYVKQDTHS